MTPYELALIDVQRIARALLVIGHGAVSRDIAAVAGMDSGEVGRRLRACSSSRPCWRADASETYFRLDKVTRNWSLTSAGVVLANRADVDPLATGDPT